MGGRGETNTKGTCGRKARQQLQHTHLPVFAFATPCRCLKLWRGHDLVARGNDVEVLAAFPQLQPPSQLLADNLHLLGDLGVSANDQAGGPLGG